MTAQDARALMVRGTQETRELQYTNIVKKIERAAKDGHSNIFTLVTDATILSRLQKDGFNIVKATVFKMEGYYINW